MQKRVVRTRDDDRMFDVDDACAEIERAMFRGSAHHGEEEDMGGTDEASDFHGALLIESRRILLVVKFVEHLEETHAFDDGALISAHELLLDACEHGDAVDISHTTVRR